MDSLFAHYLRAAHATEAPHPAAPTYRELVHNGLQAVLSDAFERTEAVLGAEAFAHLARLFLEAGGPATPFYRDIPGEFLDFALAAEHPYADLMQYEWLELIAARDPADLESQPAAAPGEVRPNVTLQAAVFARPVELITAETPAPDPFKVPLGYLFWREPETDETRTHRVGLAVLQALAHAGEAMSEAELATWAETHFAGVSGLHSVLSNTWRDLRDRGALRGEPSDPGSA